MMIPKEINNTFKEFLTSKGLRITNQRMAIFEAAYSCAEHFTAENLLDESRKLDDSVSVSYTHLTLPTSNSV